MLSSGRLALTVSLAALACSNRTLDPSGSGGAAGDLGGIGGAAGTGVAGQSGGPECAPSTTPQQRANEVPPEHRPTAKACSANNGPPDDAGAISCQSDSDCASDAAYNDRPHCLHGTCAFDECRSDADCDSAHVCACSSDYYGGNLAYHPNHCVPSNCHVDADCGANGYCSPTAGRCGTYEGFYCHTAADSCVNPAMDCVNCNVRSCIYSPQTAAFVCGGAPCGG